MVVQSMHLLVMKMVKKNIVQEYKLDNMICLFKITCSFDGCKKCPSYGYPDEKEKYCYEHAEEDMVNIKHRKCQQQDCTTIPTFNYPNLLPIYCKKHSEIGMLDVTAIRCNTENCNIIAILVYQVKNLLNVVFTKK